MKKLLGILGTVGLVGTTGMTVVACGNTEKQEKNINNLIKDNDLGRLGGETLNHFIAGILSKNKDANINATNIMINGEVKDRENGLKSIFVVGINELNGFGGIDLFYQLEKTEKTILFKEIGISILELGGVINKYEDVIKGFEDEIRISSKLTDNKEATQKQVNERVASLVLAREKFVKQTSTNFERLEKTIKEANELNKKEEDEILGKIIEKAKFIRSKERATQKEVDYITEQLEINIEFVKNNIDK